MKPGEIMRYCSYGYDLLGLIVQKISGKSLQDFAKERIFDPLGMKDTNYGVPEFMQKRVVRRLKEYPGGDWFCSGKSFLSQSGAGGVYSTIMDMAIFGQMFLNKGKYGNTRILCPISVDEMTRNQIPGISAQYGDQTFTNANWGYGWNVRFGKADDSGILRSHIAYDHGGFGGVRLLMDPLYDMLWVYFIVETGDVYSKESKKDYYTRDLFNNAVMSSIEEEKI
jgi:CubicO group peptidase (beta-lactamase class C family)